MPQTGLTAAGSVRPADRNFLGMGLLAGGIAIFSLQDLVFKGIGPGYTVHQMVFLRSFVAAPLFAALVLYEGGWQAFVPKRPLLVAVRSLLMFLAYTFYYLGLVALPFADAVALASSSSLFITALSVPLLGERVGPRRWAAVVVGFIGVLVLIRPGSAIFDWAALFPVGSALCYGVMQLIARKIGPEVPASVMNFHAMLLYIAVAGAMGLAFGDGRFAQSGHASLGFMFRPWIWPSATDLALIAATGVIAFIGFYCLTQAYRIAQPNVVTPFEYTGLLWAAFWGYAIWSEVPDRTALLGMALILGAGLYIIHREARLQRAQQAAAP